MEAHMQLTFEGTPREHVWTKTMSAALKQNNGTTAETATPAVSG
jgi:hypothetical protein